tara:strand:- start:1168 stop:1971 length:804 start_codon:yes stop_codon:yes gene_type:complete
MSTAEIEAYLFDLESKIAAKLLLHGPQGSSLTLEGRATLSAVRKLFSALDEYGAQTDFSKHVVKGELRIAAIDNIVSNSGCPLADDLKSFSAAYSGIRLKLDILPNNTIEEAVLTGEYHFGIGSFYNRKDRLAYQPLFREEQCLYCSKGHPLFDRPGSELTPADLLSQKYVMRGYMEEAETDLLPASLPHAVSDHAEGIVLLILTGKFIGYLPTHFAEQWVRRSELKPILEKLQSYSSPMYLVYPNAGNTDPVRHAFLAHCSTEFEI